LLLLLLASIIVNSTLPISRQNIIFDCFRNKKGGQREISYFDRFLLARAPQILTQKEQVFDMPIPTNYGSTGRPPGEYRLRHSFKEITDNLESPYPPFDIFFIKTTNNNNSNDNICYYNNGGIQTTIINYNDTSNYDDNKEADTAHSIHRFDLLFNNNNNNNSDISSNDNNNNYINSFPAISVLAHIFY
jgi:hypothetical protein